MADIDLATLTPRARLSGDHVVVYRDAVTDEIGIIPVTDFLSAIAGLTGKVLFNDAGQPVVASDVEIEGGQLRLPVIAPPAVPAPGGLKLYATSVGGRALPTSMGPSGLDSPLQPHIGVNRALWWLPHGNSNSAFTAMGINVTATGTATAFNVATGSLFAQMRRIGYHVATASTTAVAAFRANFNQFTVGGASPLQGGFHSIMRFGHSLGLPNASHRAFFGMIPTSTPTDVDPSTFLNIVGVGYDAADANWQFMSNDGSGTATKVDLGLPKPSVNQQDPFELAMFSPPGATQLVSYRFRNLLTGDTVTGTVTTALPSTTTLLAPRMQVSVGGVLGTIGVTIMGLYIEVDF
jgi:hypothetical protein